jgi:hypothetical protein
MSSFVVLNVSDGPNLEENILKWLPLGSKILVYMRKSLENQDFCVKMANFGGGGRIQVRFYPDEIRFHGSKLRNFVSNQLLDEKIGGFVHVLDDSVQIYNPIGAFTSEIERMMSVFDLKSWFNTSCDECNYVYSKYNPRLFIAVDEPEAAKRYGKTVAWCSNANTVWICYDMDKCGFEDIRFEERFQFPMYYIIEFLARRRNTKKPGQLDYMNYYPSVPEELNVFRTVPVKEGHHFTNDEIQNEGRIFNEMKVDNHPDTSLDVLMEDMHSAIMRVSRPS